MNERRAFGISRLQNQIDQSGGPGKLSKKQFIDESDAKSWQNKQQNVGDTIFRESYCPDDALFQELYKETECFLKNVYKIDYEFETGFATQNFLGKFFTKPSEDGMNQEIQQMDFGKESNYQPSKVENQLEPLYLQTQLLLETDLQDENNINQLNMK